MTKPLETLINGEGNDIHLHNNRTLTIYPYFLPPYTHLP